MSHALEVSRLSGTRTFEFLDRKGRLWALRSSWERDYAAWLDEQRLTWRYEPDRLLLSDGTVYVPDFYVEEWESYVEIKGSRWPIEKVELARSMGHAIKLIHGRGALRAAVLARGGDSIAEG